MLRHAKIYVVLSLVLHSGLSFALDITIPPSLQDKVTVSVYNDSTRQTVYSYQPNKPMLIASNMKLVTSYVALKNLGANFQWKTTLGYSGEIRDHVLNGNLYLIGGGDPTLTSANISKMLESINSLGIYKINGKLIYNGSIFNQNVTSSELYPEPFAAYSVDPAGLMIDGNLSNIKIKINNGKIKLSSNISNKYKLINQLKLAPQKYSCADPSSYITIQPQKNATLSLVGTIPSSCNNKNLPIYALNNHDYNITTLHSLLQKKNLLPTKGIVEESTPLNYKLISQTNSEPLGKILVEMNQQSNNLYAKTLLLSLGAYKSTNQQTYTEARQLYLQSLPQSQAFNIIENGAGLSRNEQMTASQIINILNELYLSPESQIIISSLPSPMQSGTLQNEFTNFKNRLYAKTGSLSDTKAYSGYFFSKNGNTYSISFIANNIGGKNHDQLLQDFKTLVTNILTSLDNAKK